MPQTVGLTLLRSLKHIIFGDDNLERSRMDGEMRELIRRALNSGFLNPTAGTEHSGDSIVSYKNSLTSDSITYSKNFSRRKNKLKRYSLGKLLKKTFSNVCVDQNHVEGSLKCRFWVPSPKFVIQ